MPPRTNQCRQAGHRARGIAAAANPLHAVIQPNGGGLVVGKTRAVIPRQAFNLRCSNAAHGGSTFRWPLQRPFLERRPARGAAGNVVMVQPVVGDQLVHQRQRQRRVSARQQGNVFMAFFSGFAFSRIDADQFCAISFGLAGVAPKVQIAANRIAAPDDDEFGFGKKLHPHTDLAAQCLGEAFTTGRRANRAVQA